LNKEKNQMEKGAKSTEPKRIPITEVRSLNYLLFHLLELNLELISQTKTPVDHTNGGKTLMKVLQILACIDGIETRFVATNLDAHHISIFHGMKIMMKRIIPVLEMVMDMNCTTEEHAITFDKLFTSIHDDLREWIKNSGFIKLAEY
jgi:hypothetical protein